MSYEWATLEQVHLKVQNWYLDRPQSYTIQFQSLGPASSFTEYDRPL